MVFVEYTGSILHGSNYRKRKKKIKKERKKKHDNMFFILIVQNVLKKLLHELINLLFIRKNDAFGPWYLY